MKILIHSPTPMGGLAEHAHYQARALFKKAESFTGKSERGLTFGSFLHSGAKQESNLEVTLLCSRDFLDGRKVAYNKEEVFCGGFSFFSRFAGRLGELLDRSLRIIGEQWRLAWEVACRRPDAVLLASYSEYLAPFWVWPHWVLANLLRVLYVANLHDPVRDFVVGPRWWHDLSVKMAYWPISVGVVHQRLQDPSPVPSHVHVVEAPVGVYDLQESPEDPEAIRAAWGMGGRVAPEADSGGRIAGGRVAPEDGRSQLGDGRRLESPMADGGYLIADGSKLVPSSAKGDAFDARPTTLVTSAPLDVVFLAFGFIRDNKNLDLVIRALAENPAAVLVVMGRAQSKKDKPLEFYRNLAAELGFQDRVKFFDGFVPNEKLASYFAAADVVVLTYDKSFHSQSGVLNIAARARRPVLASAGESPLKDCVQRFRLGVFVEPDDLGALKEGMAKLINAKCEMRNGVGEDAGPDWEGYEAFASWDVNVCKILAAIQKTGINCIFKHENKNIMTKNALCFEPRLENLYKTRKTIGRSGKENSATGLSTPHNLLLIRSIIQDKKPLRTLEIGMAYGGSSLTILSTLREVHCNNQEFFHTSIDPFQSHYDYCGVELLRICGHEGKFECLEERSDRALPDLVVQERNFDFIYIDGSHIFENVFIDFFYSTQILKKNGLILFDDCADPHVDKVIRFIRSNLGECLEPYPLEKYQMQKSFIKKLANKLGYAQTKGFRKIGDFPREYQKLVKF